MTNETTKPVVTQAALDRVTRYLEVRRAQPMTQLGDFIHTVNVGTEWEGELLLSDLEAVAELAHSSQAVVSQDLVPVAWMYTPMFERDAYFSSKRNELLAANSPPDGEWAETPLYPASAILPIIERERLEAQEGMRERLKSAFMDGFWTGPDGPEHIDPDGPEKAWRESDAYAAISALQGGEVS